MCVKYIRIWIDNNYDDDENVVDVCVGGWLIVYKDKRQKGKNRNVGTWWSWWCLIMSIEKNFFLIDWLIDFAPLHSKQLWTNHYTYLYDDDDDDE